MDKKRPTIKDVPKIKVVILQSMKNLLFFFSSQKIKEKDPLTYSLRTIRKSELARILKHSLVF